MVSVLLATYRGERFLPQQLASLRAQSMNQFRVLMQDDGSDDGTVEMLNCVAAEDARFRLGAEGGGHRGAAGNFLSLLRQDDAPYTALCDQDDVWHADRLAVGLSTLRAAEARLGTSTPLLCHSDCRLVDEAGRVMARSFFRHQGWRPDATTLPQLLVQNNATGCTMLMNAALRCLVVTHGDATRMYMHDWLIALTAASFGQVLVAPGVLVDYRQHDANVLGASRTGLLRRGMSALGHRKRVRQRIRLTYDHARWFAAGYGDMLPEAARRVVDAYLQTEELPRLRRIAALRQGNYVMQSWVTRWGQYFLG